MDDHQQHLRRGFNWLGGATVIAKLIDFGTIVVVLFFLTKAQVGVASLVISIGAVVESVNDLGTGVALIQARTVSRLQLDTVFWLIAGFSVLLAGVILLVAPVFQDIYGIAGMTVYLAVIALKQPVVGAAAIPLTLMNRNLQYERIAIVNVVATFAAALTRLGLAIAGAGTWALVAGFAAHGLYTLIGAQVARPFAPRWKFHYREISQLLHFGVRASASNALQLLFKNVDYLLIGWLYGPSQLAIYRVAFDVAMEPVVAVATLVDRTSMPVFARVWSVKEKLLGSLKWSLGRLEILILPVMGFLVLAADPLMSLLHDRQGHSYIGAAWPLKLLAIAAMLRVTLEMIYPLMMASGKPGAAVRLSATTLILLSAGLLSAGLAFRGDSGIVAMSAVWLAVYPPLLIWAGHYLKKNWGIRARELAGALTVPLVGTVGLIVIGLLVETRLAGTSAFLRLAADLVMTGITCLTMFFYLERSGQLDHKVHG